MGFYKSIEEIERDIEILKLKSSIQEEKIKLRMYQTKEDLAPQNLFKDLLAQTSIGISIFKIIRQVLKRRK